MRCTRDCMGRGGVAETVDETVGRIYSEPTSAALLDAIDAWESQGCPHDPAVARRRAESLSVPVFRDQILRFLAEVVAGARQHLVPPAPHLREWNRQDAGVTTGGIEDGY